MIDLCATNLAEQGGQPERRIGRFHKSLVSGRRPVTLDVELNRCARE